MKRDFFYKRKVFKAQKTLYNMEKQDSEAKIQRTFLLENMNQYCSYCGLETWACGCGGHCFNQEEYNIWIKKFGKSKQFIVTKNTFVRKRV